MKSLRCSDLIAVGAALLALLALSALTVLLPPAGWKTPVALAIAAFKLGLIVWYFMRLRAHPALVRIFALAGIGWLGLLAVLLSADYLTR